MYIYLLQILCLLVGSFSFPILYNLPLLLDNHCFSNIKNTSSFVLQIYRYTLSYMSHTFSCPHISKPSTFLHFFSMSKFQCQDSRSVLTVLITSRLDSYTVFLVIICLYQKEAQYFTIICLQYMIIYAYNR